VKNHHVALLELPHVLADIGYSGSMRVDIINKDGNVIAKSNNDASYINQSDQPEVQAALDGRDGFDIRYQPDGDRVAYVAVPLGSDAENAVLRISANDVLTASGFTDFNNDISMAFLLALLVVVTFATIASRKLFSPLRSITKGAMEFSGGNLAYRISEKEAGSFDLLARALNDLASNLSDKINELYGEKKAQELILDEMDNVVLLVNQVGIVTSINLRGRYTFHSGRNTCLTGMHNLDIVGSQLLDKTITECLSDMQSKIIDLKITRNNIQYLFHVFVRPMVNLSSTPGKVALCVFHDVTALLALYERQADFIASASHELATPLTSIKGFSETLLDGALASPELSEKFVRIIHEESDHMQKLLKDLLQLARLDSSEYRKTIPLSSFAAAGFLENVRDRLAQQIANKELSINIVYTDEPLPIYANPDWLKQVLLNLMENAVKYSPAKSQITLSYKNHAGMAVFSIADQGIGIAQENIPFVFDRFYRADKARTKGKTQGTGLGLSIAKFIVELFGGSISVKSRINVGSTFTVAMPLAKAEEMEMNEDDAAGENGAA
jgi:two-component system phosphate regulon sensor histidine kinase PhoR